MKTPSLIFAAILLLMGCKRIPEEKMPESKETPDYSAIRHVLDSIHTEDQTYRSEIASIKEAYGWESEEMNAQWAKIRATDSSNLIVVEKVLNQYGWLGSEQIGTTANSTLFLVIQHSNQLSQEKYLPLMRQAVKEGKARSQSLALLEDRVGLGKGELQLYGSQIGTDPETGEMYVLPLFEPEKVNERRAKVGLGPIEEYISHWGLRWDVEVYKKNLPKWLKK